MTQNETDVNYELGQLVGHFIVWKFLPSLSTDLLKTNVRIFVPLEVEREWKLKQKAYDKLGYNPDFNSESHKLYYENLAWYKENIEQKFLPEVLVCDVPSVKFTNESKFIDGLRTALWDCDMSHYDTNGIEIDNKDGCWYTRIKLKYTK